MHKKIIFWGGIICAILAITAWLYFSYNPLKEETQAAPTDNTLGWAWSENIGWISTNCYNDFNNDGLLENFCGGSNNYGINIDSGTGLVTGYAWSENIGWIQFNPAGPYPSAPNNSVRYNSTNNELSGWAKILVLGDDGWIKFKGLSAINPPVDYQLCRGCNSSDNTCQICHEFSADNGSGIIGTQCNNCNPSTLTCGRTNCSTYKYGVVAIPYIISGIGTRYALEGWAYNDNNGTSNKNIGWIHFGGKGVYGNYNPPATFSNVVAVPTQLPPPDSCKNADLSWDLANWASWYEVKRSNPYDSDPNCASLADSDYVVSNIVDVSNCTPTGCKYQDLGLINNQIYCYKILAWNNNGSTVNGDGAQRLVMPLCAVEDFTANGEVCGEIALSWTKKGGAIGYEVYRGLNSDSCATLNPSNIPPASPPANCPLASLTISCGLNACGASDKCCATDQGIIPLHTYYYNITAVTPLAKSPLAEGSSQTSCYKGPNWEER